MQQEQILSTTQETHSGPSGGPRSRQKSFQEPSNKTPLSDIEKCFQRYSKQYDETNDRRERIVKRSRDITIGSKRLIFTLHRIYDKPLEEIAKEMEVPVRKVQEEILGLRRELYGQGYWRFEWSFTPGLQEYLEAVTFLYFLLHGTIPTIEYLTEQVNSVDPSPEEASKLPPAAKLVISLKDYLLGIADMTGEAMRLAVNCATKGDLETPKRVMLLLQRLHASFSCLPESHELKDLPNKLEVMRQSLQKVENLCSKVIIRRAEFPGIKLMGMDADGDAMME